MLLLLHTMCTVCALYMYQRSTVIVGRPCIVARKPTALNFLIPVSVHTNLFLFKLLFFVRLIKMSSSDYETKNSVCCIHVM